VVYPPLSLLLETDTGKYVPTKVGISVLDELAETLPVPFFAVPDWVERMVMVDPEAVTTTPATVPLMALVNVLAIQLESHP
jgi:hypothetical protein